MGVIVGSDGVFDNLFLDEIQEICNEFLIFPSSVEHTPIPMAKLAQAAQQIVKLAHRKADQDLDATIGRGGKVDDTSVVVSEVVPWTTAHAEQCSQITRRGETAARRQKNTCLGFGTCGIVGMDGFEEEDEVNRSQARKERTSSESNTE